MRVTTKGARTFFLLMLTVLAILGIYQCFTMANAFNLSPYTFKLRSKLTAADSVSIYGGSLHAEHVDSVIVVTMRAGDKVITDTIQGAASVVGIVDDTLRLDADSTGAYAIITFGGWGGGIRWNRSTDKMQFTNDFSTWTDIGSGTGGSAGAEIHDSLDANWSTFTAGGGTDSDSTFVAHRSSRWLPLPDSTPQYIGATGDSTMLRFISDSSIIAFAKVFYDEDVDDSALVTWGSMMAQVGATGSGDITGVITSGDWLEGGASSGDVALNIRSEYEAAFNLNGDTTTIDGDFIKLYDGIGASIVMGLGSVYWDAEAYYQYATTAISMGVGGGSSEFQIPSQNNVYFGDTTDIRVPRAKIATWSMLYDSADYMIRGIGVGAAGTMFVGTGTSAAPTFTSIHSILDTLFAIGDAAGDTMWANTPAYLRAVALKDSINATKSHSGVWTLTGNWVNTTNPWADNEVANNLTVDDAGIATTIMRDSELKDSIHAARTISNVWTITGDWVNTTTPWADNEVANNLTVDDAGIASTITRDTEAQGLIRDSLFANSNAFLKAVALKDSINATKTHSGVWTITGNWVNTTNPWADNEVADNITVTGMGDLTDITAGNGLTGTSLTGPSPTINVVAGANGLTVNADSIYIDTTKVLRTKNIIANWITPWPDSAQGIGSGAGLTIGSSITLGTDITDDTLVVDYYPEYEGAVLADLIIPTWKDSIKIYGYIDTVAGMGNTMYFNDSTLTSGLHRRGVSLTINHPMRVDSLRYIIVQGLVKDSSATNTMWLKGMLRTSNFRAANVDSNAASTIKDYDSLGGDYGDVASVRQFVLSGGAVTVGTPWHLLLIARHGSGTAWNWAQVGRIRAVYSRTRL